MLPSHVTHGTVLSDEITAEIGAEIVVPGAGRVVTSRARGDQRSDDSAALEQGSRSDEPASVMRQGDQPRRGPTLPSCQPLASLAWVFLRSGTARHG